MAGELETVQTGFHAALKAFAAAQTPVPAIAWPDIPFEASAHTLYLEPRFLPNRGRNSSIGTNPSRRPRGLFQVDVHYSPKAGFNPGSAMADAIMAYFRPPARRYIVEDAITIRLGFGGQPPYRGASFLKDGWSVIPVTVTWWVDIVPA